MPPLSELQRGFVAATIFTDRTALAGLGVLGTRGLDASARVAIYRNNVLANYHRALAATYPVVEALVGRAFFGAAIDAFVRAHPSRRGDVNRYGAELARFLERYPPARELGYLPDVARLEWSIDQAAIAADAPPLDLRSLAAVPQSALGALRLSLAPSARFVASPYPIFRIWQMHQPGYASEAPIDLGEGGDRLLVVRGTSGIAIRWLGPGEHAFLVALGRNVVLDDAVERALAVESGFLLAEVLKNHVAAGAIVGFRAPA